VCERATNQTQTDVGTPLYENPRAGKHKKAKAEAKAKTEAKKSKEVQSKSET